MGTFANLISINASQGRYAGPPAVAVIDAKATAVSTANRLAPLGHTTTNHNIIMLGENVAHIGVRARVGTGTITTMPSVNIYRLYGPAEAFPSTAVIANDGTVEFDAVNHSFVNASVYAETLTAFAFTGAVSNAVTSSKRNASYYYSDWAIGDCGSYVYQDTAPSLFQGATRNWLIPTYGARAVLVFHTVAANVSTTCDVLVYPFARGNNG
jgi:hypothetical protein